MRFCSAPAPVCMYCMHCVCTMYNAHVQETKHHGIDYSFLALKFSSGKIIVTKYANAKLLLNELKWAADTFNESLNVGIGVR